MKFDVVVIGAGAAGLMCAGVAGQRGLRVALLDHSATLAEKIRISGGGRCNFTNLHTKPENFLSANPHFCRSALSRYTPQDFLQLVGQHRIPFHEKHKGQLFCDESSQDIIDMLWAECERGQVQLRQRCTVDEIQKHDGDARQRFTVRTSLGEFNCANLVIATGGLSIPKIGATDFAFKLAQQFGLRVVETRPALVPLTFDPHTWAPFTAISGAALEVEVHTAVGKEKGQFREDLLFTHRGLSGPAILQISSYWQPGHDLSINLLPEMDAAELLLKLKRQSKQTVLNALMSECGALLPRSVATAWLDKVSPSLAESKIADVADKLLRAVGAALNDWRIRPQGSEGYRKAEVTRGGVDTRDIQQQSLEVRTVPGLYFIGEAVDVTGWLGGYNFQWAWASAVTAALALSATAK
ncbi:NAD(P)/FAD-dependent oxidoreductase [Parvibium lacunae]|uniref:NAD(P)/FAD-dependent oxidoreductase n=1 Tax=Parvibium lacunae TaxID=1888893 RepID=A0A368L4F0_9BURK|nr:NAD(P)/FAD-dependent oxidoreductase [Parvibium lacunae]RCS58449.1 NAD(P)/FAD-dependent oxidoreductase [Parvibium lacunae]